ncbi:MAG: DNA/RNA non-specific endonuclease [Flavobacteriales bacterium]|nr:DNA/RNA non-specific endonuclease [Flavobacteriales bacterium]
MQSERIKTSGITTQQQSSGRAQTVQFKDYRSENSAQLKVIRLANNASANAVIQRVTSIKYDTTAFDMETGDKKEIVGKKMEATLDPNDKVRGSAPGDGVQAELMGLLKANGYKRMVRGHLLNGQLGGLGIAANLFPITTQANAKHKNHVENPIKDQVTKGKEIKYVVTVQSQNKMSNPNANFVCDARATDGSWSRSEVIQSAPGKTATRGANIEGATTMNTDSMSFKSSSLPKGWGEKGRGYSDNADHNNTVGKSSFSFNGDAHAIDSSLYAKGAHFKSGVIDRQEYANELIGKYNGDPTNKWPIYFSGKPYTSQELEDYIDTAPSGIVEAIISKLEALL